MAADAFIFAFLLPNIFRRLFGEGAFSQGFVPLFSRAGIGKGGDSRTRSASPKKCWRCSCRS